MKDSPLNGKENLAAIRERVHLLNRGCKCASGCSTNRCGQAVGKENTSVHQVVSALTVPTEVNLNTQ